MSTTRWEEEEYRVRYYYLSLELFNLQNKLNSLEEFLHMHVLTDRLQQMRDGDSFQARRTRFMFEFLTYCCIEDTFQLISQERERLFFILPLISILVEALIHGGKVTKASSSFVSFLFNVRGWSYWVRCFVNLA